MTNPSRLIRPPRPAMSRGFVCSLAAVAMTLLAWFTPAPWQWLAWPALSLLTAAAKIQAPISEWSSIVRGLFMALLIGANVAFWAVVMTGTLAIGKRFLTLGRKSRGRWTESGS